MFQNYVEARAGFAADRAQLEALGAVFPLVESYVPEPWKRNAEIAMDENSALTTDPNTGIPAMLTTTIDPEVFRILFAPTKAAQIYTERKKGDWTDQTAMFPVVEETGEVSSYGDFNENGRSGANMNWPQRQSYLFQTVVEYGELEIARAGLGRVNWVSEQNQSAASVMNKFANLTYFFGVQGLQNYGALNDPLFGASLTPALKAYGGTAWIVNGVVKASANEIFDDIQSLFAQMVLQTGGLVDADSPVVLAMSNVSAIALTQTNSFNVNVKDLLKKNFPNIRFETAVQFGQRSLANPQGVVGGNLVQMFVENIDGQQSVYSAFNEKMRGHPIIRAMSSWKQKMTGGTWGSIVRMPVSFTTMLGV